MSEIVLIHLFQTFPHCAFPVATILSNLGIQPGFGTPFVDVGRRLLSLQIQHSWLVHTNV